MDMTSLLGYLKILEFLGLVIGRNISYEERLHTHTQRTRRAFRGFPLLLTPFQPFVGVDRKSHLMVSGRAKIVAVLPGLEKNNYSGITLPVPAEPSFFFPNQGLAHTASEPPVISRRKSHCKWYLCGGSS